MNLKDKVAIVTGAGSGVGRALALEFGAQGAHALSIDLPVAKAHSPNVEVICSGAAMSGA